MAQFEVASSLVSDSAYPRGCTYFLKYMFYLGLSFIVSEEV